MSENNYREASSRAFRIPGARGTIFAECYLPEGRYPAPTVVLCHGIPGNERLFDFTVYLREQGFAALSFHYSGCWGSDGDYSMLHCYEDTRTVLDYVRNYEPGLFDPQNIFVLGHSMGGLMASHAIGETGFVKGGVIIMPYNGIYAAREAGKSDPDPAQVDFINNCGLSLRNFSWSVMEKECLQDPCFFDLAACGKKLAAKPVLLISGSRDSLLPGELHKQLLIDAVKANGGTKLEEQTFASDHGMNFFRQDIKSAIAAWLRRQL